MYKMIGSKKRPAPFAIPPFLAYDFAKPENNKNIKTKVEQEIYLIDYKMVNSFYVSSWKENSKVYLYKPRKDVLGKHFTKTESYRVC